LGDTVYFLPYSSLTIIEVDNIAKMPPLYRATIHITYCNLQRQVCSSVFNVWYLAINYGFHYELQSHDRRC